MPISEFKMEKFAKAEYWYVFILNLISITDITLSCMISFISYNVVFMNFKERQKRKSLKTKDINYLEEKLFVMP